MGENIDMSIFDIKTFSEAKEKFKELHNKMYEYVIEESDPLDPTDDFLYHVLNVCIPAAKCYEEEFRDEKIQHYIHKMLVNYGIIEGGE